MNEDLEPLRSFILPGGGAAARPSSISPAPSSAGPSARRSRRRAASLNPLALTYLNRLSDHLFVLGALGGA